MKLFIPIAEFQLPINEDLFLWIIGCAIIGILIQVGRIPK